MVVIIVITFLIDVSWISVHHSLTVQEHSGNEKSCVWHASDFADGELKDELFCIRFPSVESESLGFVLLELLYVEFCFSSLLPFLWIIEMQILMWLVFCFWNGSNVVLWCACLLCGEYSLIKMSDFWWW